MLDERNYWLGFSVFSGIGPIKFKKLLACFGSAKDAWEASKIDLERVVGEKLAIKFDKFRNKFSIRDYLKQLEKKEVSFLILTDSNYPELLKQIKNPPFLMYVKGDATVFNSSRDPSDDGESRNDVTGLDFRFRGNDKVGSQPFDKLRARREMPTIAVVGTRKTTQYGREVTKILTRGLVEAGFTIVSGLAIGIDAISHKTAIENKGKTIAVLGCGVDCCYPLANQAIYNSIVKDNGCIVSEYPLGIRPTRGSFPVRNRIIAGLSMGVLVTEGAEDSGSLITAEYAKKFNRKVFAVPGPITSSMSRGPYKLIQKGAKLVTATEDVLREFKISAFAKASADKQNSKLKNATAEELEILRLLGNEPLHFDELVRRTRFDSSKTGSILSVMEIKGLVKGLELGQFSIAS